MFCPVSNRGPERQFLPLFSVSERLYEEQCSCVTISVQRSIAYLGKAMDHKVYCLTVVNLGYFLSVDL